MRSRCRTERHKGHRSPLYDAQQKFSTAPARGSRSQQLAVSLRLPVYLHTSRTFFYVAFFNLVPMCIRSRLVCIGLSCFFFSVASDERGREREKKRTWKETRHESNLICSESIKSCDGSGPGVTRRSVTTCSVRTDISQGFPYHPFLSSKIPSKLAAPEKKEEAIKRERSLYAASPIKNGCTA